MRRLIYRSHVAPRCGKRDMESIVAVARERNARLEITGALFSVDGYFFQCLEGVDSRVKGIMASIERDPRHSDLTILHRGLFHRHERWFRSWNMAAIHGNDAIVRAMRTSGFNPSDPEALGAISMFEALSRQCRASARPGAIRIQLAVDNTPDGLVPDFNPMGSILPSPG